MELFIVCNCFWVSILCGIEVMSLVKMISFVLQPYWVPVLNVNIHCIFTVAVHLLWLGKWGFFRLRLSSRDIFVLLFSELKFGLIILSYRWKCVESFLFFLVDCGNFFRSKFGNFRFRARFSSFRLILKVLFCKDISWSISRRSRLSWNSNVLFDFC